MTLLPSLQQVNARTQTIKELHEALHRLWDELGLCVDDDAVLADFAKLPTAADELVLSLERIAEYERLIAEARKAKVGRSISK